MFAKVAGSVCNTKKIPLVTSFGRTFCSQSHILLSGINTSRPNYGLKLSTPTHIKLSQPHQSPLGPLIRILMAAAPILFSAGFQAFSQAYQQVAGEARNRASAALPIKRQMTKDEALKILGFEGKTPSSDEIEKVVEKLIEINTPSEKFGGSPYLIRKVNNARDAILGPKEETDNQQQADGEKK